MSGWAIATVVLTGVAAAGLLMLVVYRRALAEARRREHRLAGAQEREARARLRPLGGAVTAAPRTPPSVEHDGVHYVDFRGQW